MRYAALRRIPGLKNKFMYNAYGSEEFKFPYYNSVLRVPIKNNDNPRDNYDLWFLLRQEDLSKKEQNDVIKELNAVGIKGLLEGKYLPATPFTKYVDIDMPLRKVTPINLSGLVGSSEKILDDELKLTKIQHNFEGYYLSSYVLTLTPLYYDDYLQFINHYSYTMFTGKDFFRLDNIFNLRYAVINSYFLYDSSKDEFIHVDEKSQDRFVEESYIYANKAIQRSKQKQIEKINAENEANMNKIKRKTPVLKRKEA